MDEKVISTKGLLVSEVLDSFDVEKIQKYMKKVNWTWAFPYEIKDRVPTESEIFHAAYELLNNVKWSNHPEIDVYWLSSGGLTAYKDNKTFEIWIDFLLDEEKYEKDI